MICELYEIVFIFLQCHCYAVLYLFEKVDVKPYLQGKNEVLIGCIIR